MSKQINRDVIQVEFIPGTAWYKRSSWRLLRPYISKNGHIIVPAGFVTDGASVPWFLSWRFSSTGPYFGAAIIHDYLLVNNFGWDKANYEFREEMKALDVSGFEQWTLYNAVVVWAKIKRLFGSTR